MVVASCGTMGLAVRISSTVVLKRAARAGRVSPFCAVYSTSSPGLYSGLPDVGAGTGVEASGVIMFLMMLSDGLGVQAATRAVISRRVKKHRVVRFPLCSFCRYSFKALCNVRLISKSLLIFFTDDHRPRLSVKVRGNDLISFDKFTFIRFVACIDSPAAQDKWDRSICNDPFAIELARKMQMRARGDTAFAGRMPNAVIPFQPLSFNDAFVGGDMQVKDIPTGQ